LGLGDGWISVIYEIYTSMGWKLGGLAMNKLEGYLCYLEMVTYWKMFVIEQFPSKL